MKKVLIYSLSLLLAFFITAAKTPEKISEGEVEWLTIEEAVERNKTEPRKFFIDVYTDWCGWCKRMDKDTFQHPQIAKYLGEKYYAVKFNAEQKEEIRFAEHTFKFVAQGNRGYHEFAVALTNGRLSYPTVVFLDEELKMIQPLPGYQKPQDLEPILHYFGENGYKNTAWEDFAKGFKSSID